MVSDRIEREVLIDAPPDVVWAVVTEPEHVARWFSDTAEIDLRPGGEALLTWDEHGTYRVRVERVEPPHTFAFRWIRRTGVEPGDGTSTLVVFELVAEGGRTRLRVAETGFADLAWPDDEKADYANQNDQGWARELEELRVYVERDIRPSGRR